MFHDVSKIVLCGRRNTFATFSKDALHFSWLAQHFGHLRCHFAWQAQHFRCVVLRVFGESHCQRCAKWWHSPLHSLHFTLHTLHSTLHTLDPSSSIPHFTLDTLHSTLSTLHSTLHTFHFTLHTSHLHLTLHTIHPTLYTLHSTFYTLHSTLYTLHPTLYTLHSTFHTLHSTLYTLHFTLHTLYSTLYTLHFTLYTPHFTLYTLHPTLYTVHPTLYTFHFPLHTWHSTLSTPLHTLHSPLYTVHPTLSTFHSTLYTLHFTLRTLHFTLHTLHSTFYTLHSTLYTLHPHFTFNTWHSTLYIPHSTHYTPHSTLSTFHSTLYTSFLFSHNFDSWVPYHTCEHSGSWVSSCLLEYLGIIRWVDQQWPADFAWVPPRLPDDEYPCGPGLPSRSRSVPRKIGESRIILCISRMPFGWKNRISPSFWEVMFMIWDKICKNFPDISGLMMIRVSFFANFRQGWWQTNNTNRFFWDGSLLGLPHEVCWGRLLVFGGGWWNKKNTGSPPNMCGDSKNNHWKFRKQFQFCLVGSQDLSFVNSYLASVSGGLKPQTRLSLCPHWIFHSIGPASCASEDEGTEEPVNSFAGPHPGAREKARDHLDAFCTRSPAMNNQVMGCVTGRPSLGCSFLMLGSLEMFGLLGV